MPIPPYGRWNAGENKVDQDRRRRGNAISESAEIQTIDRRILDPHVGRKRNLASQHVLAAGMSPQCNLPVFGFHETRELTERVDELCLGIPSWFEPDRVQVLADQSCGIPRP